jgi:[acyl-carrier-protein] S-malonyltransferase
MGTLGILFSGQGNQYENMGLDWIQYDPRFKPLLKTTSDIFGFDLLSILESKDGRIHETKNAQPAIVLTSYMAYRTLLNETKLVPSALAGFSLGEYTALLASKVFSFESGMELLKERSVSMMRCASDHPGSMSAILGLDNATIEQVCFDVSKTHGLVVPANYNCPNQLVISGVSSAVEEANIRLKNAGAKRCLTLNVSGAFHSPLMLPAASRLETVLKTFVAEQPVFPLYANVTGEPYVKEDIKPMLVKQMVSPVKFETTIRNMMDSGITHFIEIGPGTALSGFVRKINPEAHVTNLSSVAQLDTVKGWLNEYGFNQ